VSIADTARFVALASREIKNGDVLFVGIGIPSLAAICAKHHHAPNAVLIYESGAIDADPPVPPLSTGSPSVVANTSMVASCLGVFSLLQQGHFDLGMLSAAQIDRHGNLNSTMLKRAGKPPMQLVGSGGAHDIALLARRVLLMAPHDPRRFVEHVDFVTSPGVRSAENGMADLPIRGAGPAVLMTPRGRFTFEGGELTLDAVAPGFTADQAVEGFSWTVRRTARLGKLSEPDHAMVATAMELVELGGEG
jgi:glutaconate CoA-transferase subunit B